MKIPNTARYTYRYWEKMEKHTHTRKYTTSHRTLYQDAPVIHEMLVSLEEISRGCTKKMKIATKTFNDDYSIASTQEQIVKMVVPPGSHDGTEIVLPSAGDKKPGLLPGDIVFIIRERQHPNFHRDKDNNLIYKVDITLREALTGCNVDIPLPNGESLKLSTVDVVSHGTRKQIPGKGLPRSGKDPGDLYVDFSVIFPMELNTIQKEELEKILPD